MNQLTAKHKYFLLLVGIPILLLVVFNLGIKRTISNYKELKSYKSEMLLLQSGDKQLEELNNLKSEINFLIDDNESDIDLNKGVIDVITKSSGKRKINLWQLPDQQTYVKNDIQLIYSEAVVKGDYKSLLNFLYHLETKNKIGIINAINIYKVYDRKNKTYNLFMKTDISNINVVSN